MGRYNRASVPRHRTARTAVLGVPVRRPATGKPPSRSTSAFRRRIVVGILVVLALVLITFSFRKPDSGPVASVESAAATALRPFTIAGERVAQPFRDVYGWADSLLTARSDAKRLKAETEALRQQVIQNQFAANENAKLKALLAFRDGPRFPGDYTGLAAAVIARPSGTFAQEVVVAAGSNDGVALDAPVVTADGFLGRVTRVYSRSSRVTLLSDEQLAVSAIDVKTGAAGIVKHGRGSAVDADPRPRPEESEGLRRRHDRHGRVALQQACVALSERDPDRPRYERRSGRHRSLEADPGRAVCRLRACRCRARSRPQGRSEVSPAVGVRVALIIFVVAILQVSAFSSVTVSGSGPDVLLVTLVSVALLRGAVTGAVTGFFAGLIVDVATLGTLGLTALLLTLAGYWAGRYGETTGRSRRHAPILATLAATVFVGLGGYAIQSMLGEPISARAVLLALPSALIWNALLIYPAFGLTRRLVGATRARRAGEGGRAPCLTPRTVSDATRRPGSCHPTPPSVRRIV